MIVHTRRTLGVAVAVTGLLGAVGLVAVPPAHAATQVSTIAAGSRRGATRIPFQISNTMQASVDVGSGNLMVNTKDVAVPGAKGGLVPFGLRFDSLSLGAGSFQNTGAGGSGWFLPMGQDTKLVINDDNSVVLFDSSGVEGKFAVASGSGTSTQYAVSYAFKKKLTINSDGTYQVKDLPSGTLMNFNSSGQLTSVKDRDQTIFTMQRSSGAQPSGVSLAGGNSVAYAYTGGRITSITPTNHVGTTSGAATYSYDSSGRLSKISLANGSNPSRDTTFTYTSGGDLASITDPVGHLTAVTYDTNHKVTSVAQGVSGDMATTRFQYLSSGSSTWTDVADPTTDQGVTPSATQHTIYDTDTSQRVTKATDPLGRAQSTGYSSYGDVASQDNGNGGTDSVSWGANSGVSASGSTAAAGSTQSASYGASGPSQYSPATATDGQNNKSTMIYDTNTGNPTSTADAGGNKASVAYNSDGTVKSSTDPAQHVTTYTESSTGQYISTITPPTGSGLGAITISGAPMNSLTNGAGETTNYTYDGQYNTTKVATANSTVTYAYDGDGRVTTRTDPNETVTYTYDPRGHVASMVTTPVSGGQAPAGSTVSYTYDTAGDMASRTVTGKTTTYTYDADHELVTMTGADGAVTRFAYDSGNNRTDTWWRTNSDNSNWLAHTHNVFGTTGRLAQTYTSTNSSDTAANRVLDLSYCYAKYVSGTVCPWNAKSTSNTDLIQYIQDNHNASKITTLGYDSSNRLTSATGWNGQDYAYKYDADGNRTQTTVNGVVKQSLTFNSDNEISASGYTYDKAGRRTADPSGGTTTWNDLGQSVTQAKGSSNSETMSYGGVGQEELLQQGNSSSTATYTYGRDNLAGTPQVEYLGSTVFNPAVVDNDANGQPVAFEDATGATVGQFMMYDGLGRLAGTIGAGGAQASTNSYDPYGAIFVANGTASAKKLNMKQAQPMAASGSASPWTTFGIQGSLSGWWKRGARWNDTATGTWTSVDPITTLNDPSRANPYAYAGNDPINATDPNGREINKTGLVALGIGLGVVGLATGGIGLFGALGADSVVQGVAAAVGFQAGAGSLSAGIGCLFGSC